jgi:hypothetical protein
VRTEYAAEPGTGSRGNGSIVTEKDKKPNIYPPSIIDHLLPGVSPDPDAVARDAYLGRLAADVAAGEADSPESEGRPGDAGMVPPRGKPQGGGS